MLLTHWYPFTLLAMVIQRVDDAIQWMAELFLLSTLIFTITAEILCVLID